MMALQSTETRNNLAQFRPKLRDFYSTNQIARFVNYYCYGVNGIEIRSRDSMIIPFTIEENRAKFFTVSLWPRPHVSGYF